MKYKALFVFFFGIVLSLISIQNSFAGWPISYTPAIEGIVTDATTGQPIENVMVSCVWYKTRMSIGDTVDLAFGSKTVITKTDGKFSFPSKTGFHVLSWFNSVMVQANHPLYDQSMTNWSKDNIKRMKKGETQYKQGSITTIFSGKYENGKIKYEISLVSLEEKIREAILQKREGKNPSELFSLHSFFNSNIGAPRLWMELKQKYGLRYNLDYIINKWKELYFEYYGETLKLDDYKGGYTSLNKEIEKIKKEGY